MGCKSCKNQVTPYHVVLVRTKTDPTISNDNTEPHCTDFQAENLENVTLIWLDESIDETKEDYEKTLLLLREINDFILTYADSKLCIDYIKSIHKETVFLIISGSLSKEVLSQTKSLHQLDSVYIFCANRSAYVHLRQDYPKVIDVFTQQKALTQSIRQQLYLFSKHSMTFSFFNQKLKSSRYLIKESASFLWFQLLLNVLKEFPQATDAQLNMLTKCEEYYRGNQKELKNIARFQKEYQPKAAIIWYTDDSFVYRLLNKALRTEDIDGLYLFRFYIIDLCKQLEEESRKNVGTMTLYRGQMTAKEDVEKLKNSIGTLISPNGFLSTSLDKQVALFYLDQSRDKEAPIQSVLFEITANSTLLSGTFADIHLFSRMPHEREVLFSIDAVFKIDNIEFSDAINCWTVRMVLTDEGMKNVREYIDVTKKQYENADTTIIFGSLLTEMNQLEKAEKYFNFLLVTADRESLKEADILSAMGRLNIYKSEHLSALDNFSRAYNIRKNCLSSNHPKIALSLNSIASVYYITGNYEKALSLQQRALEIDRENCGNDHTSVASGLDSLGMIYRDKKEYDNALNYFVQALEIQQRLLPKEHDDIAGTLWDIGLTYNEQKDYAKALQYYFDALEIFEKILPPGHLRISGLFNAIVEVYKRKNDNDAAFDFCQMKLIKLCEELGETHPAIGRLLCQIGDIFFLVQNKTDEALSHYEKALSIFEKCNAPEQEQIYFCLKRIAHIQELVKENFPMALDYHMKTLELQKRMYLPDHPEVGLVLGNVGRIHLKLKHYEDGLKYLEEAHDKLEKILPVGDSDLWKLFIVILEVYKEKEDYQLAISLCEKRLGELREKHCDNYLEVGRLLFHIGDIYQKCRNNDQALSYYEKALLVLEKCIPSDDEARWCCLNGAAVIQQEKRNFQLALDYYERTLDIGRKIYLSYDPKTGMSLANVGLMHLQLKSYENSLKYFEEALDIFERTLPAGHQEISKLFVYMVNAYKGKDDYPAALKFCQKKLIAFSETLGDTHLAVVNILFQIADIFQERNINEEALLFYEKALSILEKCNPTELHLIWFCLNRIASLQAKYGNFQLALMYHMKTLEIGRKIYSSDHHDIAVSLRNIGAMHFKLENYEDALKYLEDALQIFQSKYSSDNYYLRSILKGIEQVKQTQKSN